MPRARYNKYRAVKTPYGGHVYASGIEAARAQELDLLITMGAVRYWLRQVTFRLGEDGESLRVDYVVWWASGIVIAEDVKGRETRDFIRKKKLWAKYAPCPLHILKRRGNGWTTTVVDVRPYPEVTQ